MSLTDFLLTHLFFWIALLYAAIGSGGGSGYLAVMGIFEMDAEVMRPTALVFNVLVTSISTWKFVRQGHFTGRIFWPIVCSSIPAAFVGGLINVGGNLYQMLVGIVLLYAAWRLWRAGTQTTLSEKKEISLPLILLVGGGIGFVSGVLGIGGGIFLSPILILTGWASTKETFGITAPFVLVNSLSGLLGRLTILPLLPSALWMWLIAVGVGGWLGASIAVYLPQTHWLRRLLALVLVFAAYRMIF